MTTITETPANGFDTKVEVTHPHWNTTSPAWARFYADDTVDIIHITKTGDFGGLFQNVPATLVTVVID